MNTSRFFDDYYKQARVNSIMIMTLDGVILDVNTAFTDNFGYSAEELKGKNFSMLFTEADQQKERPRIELETVAATGQSGDENYVVNKDGHLNWCTGESLLVMGEDGMKCIVKDMVNLQSKRQLQLYLHDTEDLLDRVFESSKDIPILILDGSMKIEKVNAAFLSFFELSVSPVTGDRLSDIDHPFWNSAEIKASIRQLLTTNQALKAAEFLVHTKLGKEKKIRIDSRVMAGQPGAGRRIFIMLEDISGSVAAGQTAGG